MAQNDSHPADDLIDAIRNVWNGSAFTQGIRDAWDKTFSGNQPSSVPNDTVKQLNQQAADKHADEVRQSFMNAQKAETIRNKAKGPIAGK